MKGFDEIHRKMKLHNMPVPDGRVSIRIPEARKTLERCLHGYIAAKGGRLHWLPEYEQIADWLADNKGRGLFLYGDCGRGKSMLGYHILPGIILHTTRKVVNVFDVQEMNRNPDEVLSKHLISLDDIGTEDVSVSFGNRRLAFAEVMDAAEKHGKLVIVSTNLNGKQITERYGQRVMERIIATTRRVEFRGQSQRQ